MTDQELYTRAHELLEYKDGQLFWKFSRRGASKGKRVGCLNKNQLYRQVFLDRKKYMEHRIIFLMHHGYLPEMIDHKNGIRYDNSIENLRAATSQQNQCNKSTSKNNKVKLKGVIFIRLRNKFRADIKINGKGTTIGHFDTAEEAHEAYKKAALELHGEFARF